MCFQCYDDMQQALLGPSPSEKHLGVLWSYLLPPVALSAGPCPLCAARVPRHSFSTNVKLGPRSYQVPEETVNLPRVTSDDRKPTKRLLQERNRPKRPKGHCLLRLSPGVPLLEPQLYRKGNSTGWLDSASSSLCLRQPHLPGPPNPTTSRDAEEHAISAQHCACEDSGKPRFQGDANFC